MHRTTINNASTLSNLMNYHFARPYHNDEVNHWVVWYMSFKHKTKQIKSGLFARHAATNDQKFVVWWIFEIRTQNGGEITAQNTN